MSQQFFQPHSDTSRLFFDVDVSPFQSYGGQEVFQWRVLMRKGLLVVGATSFDHAPTRKEAQSLAQTEIAALKTRHLFVIRVKKDHIERGVYRSCGTCALSLALTDQIKRVVAHPEYDSYFRVSTYGCGIEGDGIQIIRSNFGLEELATIPVDQLPPIVTRFQRRFSVEDMAQWTMDWDDWSESRYETVAEYRHRNGYGDGERKPTRPVPCSFVLDTSKFVFGNEEKNVEIAPQLP